MRDDDVACCKLEFWAFLITCFLLITLAGLMSGLALGLLSFSHVDLEVLIKAGQPKERRNAVKILPVVKNEHFLLCTLLIVKSMAMEALPIFLDSILPTWAAILMSVTLVVAFAEILPQAVCSRYGLIIGAMFSTFVRFLLLVLYPIGYPLSMLLDWLLGEGHSALYRRAELKTLVDLHADEAGKGGDLSRHETTIISGALDLTQKTAKDAMTPISEAFTLDINSKLDMHCMGLIMSKGHSRIPVYSGNPNNIIGLIMVKNLIFCRPEDETPIKYVTIRKIPRVHEDWPLYDILNQFQKGHSHMAVVVKRKLEVKTSSTLAVDNIPNPSSNLPKSERKGIYSPFDLTKPPSISTNTSPWYSTDTELQSPAIESAVAQGNGFHSQSKSSNQGGGGIVLNDDLETLPNKLDEEVVGIITMEDLIEELLQEEILDETDEYVDVHNKIRINLLPSRKSSPSPGRLSVSHVYWRTPEPSPLSSYTPILRSPIPPYVEPPLERPTLSASPDMCLMSPKAGIVGLVHGSQSSHRVSGKLYDRLQQPADS